MIRSTCIAVLLVAVLVLAGCSSSANSTAAPTTAKQSRTGATDIVAPSSAASSAVVTPIPVTGPLPTGKTCDTVPDLATIASVTGISTLVIDPDHTDTVVCSFKSGWDDVSFGWVKGSAMPKDFLHAPWSGAPGTYKYAGTLYAATPSGIYYSVGLGSTSAPIGSEANYEQAYKLLQAWGKVS